MAVMRSQWSRHRRPPEADLHSVQSHLFGDLFIQPATKGEQNDGCSLTESNGHSDRPASSCVVQLLTFCNGDLGSLAWHLRTSMTGEKSVSLKRLRRMRRILPFGDMPIQGFTSRYKHQLPNPTRSGLQCVVRLLRLFPRPHSFAAAGPLASIRKRCDRFDLPSSNPLDPLKFANIEVGKLSDSDDSQPSQSRLNDTIHLESAGNKRIWRNLHT